MEDEDEGSQGSAKPSQACPLVARFSPPPALTCIDRDIVATERRRSQLAFVTAALALTDAQHHKPVVIRVHELVSSREDFEAARALASVVIPPERAVLGEKRFHVGKTDGTRQVDALSPVGLQLLVLDALVAHARRAVADILQEAAEEARRTKRVKDGRDDGRD